MVGVAAAGVEDVTPKPVTGPLTAKPPLAGAMLPPKPLPAIAAADWLPSNGLEPAAAPGAAKVGAKAGFAVPPPKPKLIAGWDCGAKALATAGALAPSALSWNGCPA